MRLSIGCGTRLSHRESVPMRDQRVLQLARHRGRPTDGVRWVTGTEFFVRENECTAMASLEEQTDRDLIKHYGGKEGRA